MRVVFMGSPEFSTAALEALLSAGHEIVCVYSQPPRPAGRGKSERHTPVHQFATHYGLEVRTPKSLKSEEAQAEFAALNADVAVVVAYGLILPQPILDAPRFGCLNVHASLLPRWRGAAPIQRAIMAGDEMTGVQVMQMEAGLDTGPVMMSAETRIFPFDTAGDLHDRLSGMGADLIVKALKALEDGECRFVDQPKDGLEYAAKISNAETRIDWSRPAREVCCHARGLSPAPGAWFELDADKAPVRVKVLLTRVEDGDGAPGEVLDDNLLIACGDGAVRLLQVQRAGKGPMEADEFLRGNRVPVGKVLS
ncbi:MAG: methionyl-tRNA formyltransferase [Pseudomonadota bacterium]